MITQIKLTNFKCFKEETTFPLSKFNLLTGVNGGGKSTLLQSLLLMHQSIEHDMYTTQLILNGSCVNLGSFDDVRNRDISGSEPISFEFKSSHNTSHYRLNPKNDDSMSLHISEIRRQVNPKNDDSPSLFILDDISRIDFRRFCYDSDTKFYIPENNENLFYRLVQLELSLSFRPSSQKQDVIHRYKWMGERSREGHPEYLNFERIHFISADRIGPQDFYKKATLPNFPHVGTRGEFTINLLDKMREFSVAENLCVGNDSKKLLTQTGAWLGKILNYLKVVVPYSNSNFLELLIGGYKPANVGFGYSSVLPIIVSGLIAQPEDKLIVENPEIHLHPKAQSALIQFLVAVAKTGVQVFVESHSDHVLNALRIAVLQNKLTSKEANILYFGGNDQELVTQIPIEEDGTIETWPTGFFDQIDADLNVMLGI